MTTEQKAKAYDEALEAARKELKQDLHESGVCAIQRIFPELRESEDERIRKLLVWQVYRNIEDDTNDLAQSVYDGIKGHDPDLEESIEDWKKCLAYLEKQKEQKPAQTSEEKEYIRTLKSLISDFIRDKQPEDVVFYQKIYDWLDGRHIEQKPAEWSEEDEKNCNRIIRFLEPHKTFFPTKETKEEMQNWLKNRLKSLRPSWKPTYEQLEALRNAVALTACDKELARLYNQLKKLM